MMCAYLSLVLFNFRKIRLLYDYKIVTDEAVYAKSLYLNITVIGMRATSGGFTQVNVYINSNL